MPAPTAQRTPPGPPPVTKNPLSLLSYMRRIRRGVADSVGARFARYGDIYSAPFLGREVFVLRHPEHLHEVLIAQASKFDKPTEGLTARTLGRLLGQGLLLSNGELWRRQRRLIQPAFRRERLEEYAGLVVSHAEQMLAGWRVGEELDASREMMELTLRIVSKALFDHTVTSESDTVADAMRVLRRSFGGADALFPDWLPTPGKQRTLNAIATMDAIIYALMDAPRSGGQDLLSTLRAARDAEGEGDAQGMTRRQLRDELVTLFLAGHETTSHALSWTWHLLSQHPAVEQKLHAEIDQVLAGRAPRWSDLTSLVYTEQVLCEALRLYPPAYVLARVAREPAHVGGYTIPRESDVVMWIFHTHRHERFWPDPERFDPDRFGPEQRKQIPSCAYLPFGAGTRTCIGKQFAIMEAMLILACTAQRFRLVAPAGTRVERDMSVTLAPRGGLPVRIRLRSPQTR